MPRPHDNHADASATLASKIKVLDVVGDAKIIKKTFLTTIVAFVPIFSVDEQD